MPFRRLTAMLLTLLVSGALSATELEPDMNRPWHPAEDWTEWRVRSLRCAGLVHVDSTVILRELEMLPGTGYSDQLLNEDALAVKNTNLFARMVVSVDADSSAEAVDIIYAVTERPRFLPYPILSPTENLGWVYGIGLMNRNLGGMGRSLDVEAEFGEHLNYSLQVVEPWFMGRRSPLSIYLNRRDSESTSGEYMRRSHDVVLGYRYYFDKQLSIGIQPFWKEIKVKDSQAADRVTVNRHNQDVFGGTGIDLYLNTTDIHVKPTTGSRLRIGMSLFGLGGDNQPAGSRLWIGRSRYMRLTGGRVLALNLAAESTAGRFGDYYKHYLGGRKRVRSAQAGTWPGGSQIYGNLELRLDLLKRRVYFQHVDFALGAVLFADAGVIWKERFHGDMLSAGGLGVGLRVFAPFIEVGRLDYSWSPGQGSVIQIGKGHAF